ncbi:MAG: MFS transporter [Planctomycetota bacterium]
MAQDLSAVQKRLLFWASFLSLAACGVGFAFRIAYMVEGYGKEFELTGQQIGNIAGSCFWPIAITMILFSLVVDKTGYKIPMLCAAVLQIASGIGTAMANSYEMLLATAILAGLGHGIIEAVINPACAAVYPKTKMLTILHAAWPAGLVGGTLVVIGADAVADVGWRFHALWIVVPAAIYGLMFVPCRFPVDERVRAGVPFMDMLKEVGFMGMTLASFMLVYQIGGEVLSGVFGLFKLPGGGSFFFISLGIGLAIGAAFGLYVKSLGKPLFFLLCLLMIPVATAELSTDNWIKPLMTPVLADYKIDAAWAIVFSAGVMFLLRTFAGGILKVFNPPMLMATSGVLSAVGLYWLGANAAGIAIFVAFLIYAIGQTYYWPCILGFVSEQYPKGGALTLNLVSALALLSLGMVGTPILGVASDKSIYSQAEEALAPEVVEVTQGESSYLWMTNTIIKADRLGLYGAQQVAGEGEAIIAALEPRVEADEKLVASVAKMNAGLDEQAADPAVAEQWAELGISQADLAAVNTYVLARNSAVADLEEKAEKEAALEALEDAMPEASRDGLAAYTDAMATHGKLQVAAGRDVLKFAAIFPAILVVSFIAIALYFRSIGGYKPVELYKGHEHDAEQAGGSDL